MDIQAENLEAFEKERARLGPPVSSSCSPMDAVSGCSIPKKKGARAAIVDHGLHRFLLRQVTADDRVYAMSATKRVVLE